jgi:rod shape-determining protein MreD
MAFGTNDGWQGSVVGVLGRWLMTGLLIFLLLVLSSFPFKLGHFGEIRPSFMLMAVYYWAIMRPATLSPIATFIVGLAFDLMGGFPLGLNALTLVLAQWVTRSQRKFLLGQSFIVIWMGLALVSLGAGLLQWLLYAGFHREFDIGALRPILMSVIMTAAVFPLIVLPLAAFNKSLADRS